ncbi:hypothetical protein [Burkholderia sp. BCC0405]|nr:hypothetical protein [Burkholderia sp. BCC0405]
MKPSDATRELGDVIDIERMMSLMLLDEARVSFVGGWRAAISPTSRAGAR